MTKKFFGILIIMILWILSGCNSGIEFNIGYDQMGGFGKKEINGGITVNTLEFVNSFQELKDLCDERDNPSFQENNECYSSESSKKIRSYDETYFEENMLVIYSFMRGHKTETRIDSIEVDGEQLIINARYISKKGTFEDEEFSWLILIEIKKADAEGATNLQIKHK